MPWASSLGSPTFCLRKDCTVHVDLLRPLKAVEGGIEHAQGNICISISIVNIDISIEKKKALFCLFYHQEDPPLQISLTAYAVNRILRLKRKNRTE